MLYLFLDKQTIKLIFLKKTILGQQEVSFFEKKYESVFLENGRIINSDLLASAIKEAITSSPDKINDSSVFLILPQESFYFVRTQVPPDIAPSAMNSFIEDKARSSFPQDLNDCLTATFTRGTETEKTISFFGLARDIYEDFLQALSLIDLKVQSILPETLAYFKLFEKTLRNEKKENILYINIGDKYVSGYLYDSYGLLDNKRFQAELTPDTKIEEIVKTKITELASSQIKLNRIILSGQPSETIRQDTFTKSVGVWTNPLKRIVPNFYEEYLKMLIIEGKKAFPLLSIDVCFGGFIFSSENKEFSFFKNGFKSHKRGLNLTKTKLPTKQILLFIGSFILSFLLFILVSKIKLPKMPNLFSKVKPSPTSIPTPTPTPTPAFKKSDLKIKVLNGGGVKGKATDVKDILTKKGYGEIITGNADNFDYLKTEVQIKESFSQISSVLNKDLEDYLSSFKQTVLDSSSTADLIIIIGQDFK